MIAGRILKCVKGTKCIFPLKGHRLQKKDSKGETNPCSMHSTCTATASIQYKILQFREAQLQEIEQLMTDLKASVICIFLVQP